MEGDVSIHSKKKKKNPNWYILYAGNNFKNIYEQAEL